jgi:adenine-specific DNA-methyltransferase
MARGKKTETSRPIESYEHHDKKRPNNPPVGLVTPETDPDLGQKKKTYAYEPHLDPQLVWAGKAEHTSFEVPTVSLHVHERIDPRTLIEAVRKKKNGGNESAQLGFGFFEEERHEPLHQAVEFYQHKHGWSNRLIAGDSLLVMNSLLEKEGMAGKVQMIYIDPPYGIKYGSNFQPFVNKRDVKDGRDEDLTSEPEQIRAFRDTWELGIHSYLTYLRDRLLLARELLTESGSVFVQISDENVHLVRCLMDEVFGVGNFVSLITFAKTGSMVSNELGRTSDYLVWYARDEKKLKYRKLYSEKNPDSFYCNVEIDSTVRKIKRVEMADPSLLPPQAKVFRLVSLESSGPSGEDTPLEFEGETFRPNKNSHWKLTYPGGMEALKKTGRMVKDGKKLRWKYYISDYPLKVLSEVWDDTAGFNPDQRYVVETRTKVVERCLLMTTDPGDLVFDPTCGSGTTAYVAEQWGRRWITCDTSRVALTLARQRLMTAVFDYYELAHPEEGIGSGFKYKTVPHVTLKSIANNPEIDDIYRCKHPDIEKALANLNAALKGKPIKFKVTQGRRAEQVVDFTAPDSATFTLPSGQVVKANELLEWEVPFEFPENWPEEARAPFEAFRAARRAMQKAMDEAIARHAPQETLYDQPLVDSKKVRVSGPFTVEAVPAPAVKSVDEILEPAPGPADASIARSGETLRQGEWRDELLRAGIRGKNGQYIRFARLEPLPGCRCLHAEGETKPGSEGAGSPHESGQAREPQRVVVSFGPEYGPLERRQVERAIEEARKLVPKPALIVFAAFQFDPEAAKDIDETKWPGMTLLKVQMNADLLIEDLKKKHASNESFWLIGQPDVEVRKEKDGRYVVEVKGFDYYNTKTGQIESGGADKIAVWMLDTDYDGRSLYPRQVFFPMAGEEEGWAKLARNLRAEIDEDLIEAYRGTVSLPFKPGEHKRIAVKIVDDRGIESLKVMEVE